MPDDTSFIEKLHMNNIFPSGGGGSNNAAFAPPNFNGGNDNSSSMMNTLLPIMLQEKEKDRQHQLKLAQIQHGSGVQAVANQMQQPAQPQNVVWGEDSFKHDPKDEYYKSMAANKNATLAERTTADAGKQSIAQGKLTLAQKIASGKATDAEKHEYELENIDERGSNAENLQYIRGDQTAANIGQRGNIQKDLQNTRGSQNIAAIGARLQGAKDIQSSKPIKSELPTQSRARIANNARELMNSRPELGKFITLDNNGNPTVTEGTSGFFGNKGPTPEQAAEINRIIYDTGNPHDVRLPSSTPKKGGTPTSVTPKANDPAGIR